ncbi:ABC efflux pump, inner membrane subunit [Candidatus Koribacter versatilis Ellin345]|uniref:ABC efflux pump, inner membrane subunit n=1 Tax=Koribacter versatilis (strain Ellin345) TaxID=204669 RepID=Q1IU29_KORVE|nr:ABC transporter permease [Candidatus Koribacter versatilis]ABF39621.1 ABC efflux pump, inner membrane subunit [Candidatus Koribacter versatilis Ellin345]
MSFFYRHQNEAEFDLELKFHVDERTRELVAQGLSQDEAHRRAMIELGGKEQTAQQLREVHSSALLETIVRNFRSGLRLIRRAPGFSLTVVVTLALAIGANSAVFSAINAILLSPLPYPNGDRLMLLQQKMTNMHHPVTFVSPARLEDWNRMNATFEAMTGYYTEPGSELSGSLPEKVMRAFVAPRFIQVFGVAPALGRDFTSEEFKYGGPDAVILSDSYWRRHFHADPSVIGKRLHIGSTAPTVVGVMPQSFLFPVRDADIFIPSPPDFTYAQSRDATWFTVIGRMKPGVAVTQARADLATVQAQLGRQFPNPDATIAVILNPLKEDTVSSARRSLWMIFGSVSLLLLIACTNIVALFLARTSDREHEISVRFSLGASRARIVAQLLSETFVLACIGSAIGLLLATASARVFHLLAASLPRVDEIALNWRIVGYTFVCAIVVTLLCGTVPALRATRGLSAALAASDRRTSVAARQPLQWTLVAVQVALAVTLLFGAGLLLRSFQALTRVDAGFDPSHVLTLHISGGYGETVDMKAMARRIDHDLDGIRAVPGVEGAATSSSMPGVPDDHKSDVRILEGPQDPDHPTLATNRFVSDGYFATMRIPVLAGTPCEQGKDTKDVLVNRSFADRYMSGTTPMGHHLQFGVNHAIALTGMVRGVVADTRENGLNMDAQPTVYWCIAAPDPDPEFLIRTHSDPMALSQTIRRALGNIEPNRAVFDISTLEDHLSDAYSENRLRTILLSLFALTAVSLACVGLYGTLSYSVTVRRREIGLRLALGAVRGQITKRYVWQALRVTMIGCTCGLVLAAFAGRILRGMLFGVSALDAVTFAGVIALVLGVAALAAIVPAWRASRTDPMHVLREQ